MCLGLLILFLTISLSKIKTLKPKLEFLHEKINSQKINMNFLVNIINSLKIKKYKLRGIKNIFF